MLVGVDYTIFFRQLSNSNLDPKMMREADNQDILRPVLPAIYDVDSVSDEKVCYCFVDSQMALGTR